MFLSAEGMLPRQCEYAYSYNYFDLSLTFSHVHILLFTDAVGFMHILYRLSEMFSFKAYGQRIQHLYQLKTRNIVVTVGDDEDFTPLIRVWNLDKVHVL